MSDKAVAWLRAQVGARLAAARAAAGPDWFTGSSEDSDKRAVQYAGPSTLRGGLLADYYIADRVDEADAGHIALNDPEDVMARCEAELGILDEHKMTWPDGEPEYETVEDIATDSAGGTHAVTRNGPLIPPYVCPVCGYSDGGPCATVRLLASGYRHREGYEDHWGGRS